MSVFEVLMATNTSEAFEYISMYVLKFEIIFGVSIYLLFLFSIYNYIERFNFVKKYIYVTIGIVMIYVVMGTGISYAMHRHMKWQDTVNFVRAIRMGKYAYRDLKQYEIMLHGNTGEDIVITRNEDSIPYVIYILGESTSRNHQSLYGYELETTPRLDNMKREGDIHVFTDVVSPHSHTMPVLEKLFTFYRKGAGGNWYEYNNIFDVLKKAGVNTAWISNQESSGVYGNAGRVYASKCDIGEFTLIRDSMSEIMEPYDEALFPYIDDALKKAKLRNFYVFHLMGTHGRYSSRYPDIDQWRKFDEEVEIGKNEQWKQIRAEYDNAILYNDYIVTEIINKFKDKDAIIIFTSDHGEEVYDERDYAGHDEINGSRWMIEIPMFIYTSPKFRINHPEKEKAITEAVDRPYMTDDMIHTLLDIMDIETDEYHSNCSIINKNFDVKRERVYAGKIYEK